MFRGNLRSCTVFIDNSCLYHVLASGCETRRSNLASSRLFSNYSDSFATLRVIVGTEYIIQIYSMRITTLCSSVNRISRSTTVRFTKRHFKTWREIKILTHRGHSAFVPTTSVPPPPPSLTSGGISHGCIRPSK